jgi:hypothetical protein
MEGASTANPTGGRLGDMTIVPASAGITPLPGKRHARHGEGEREVRHDD